MSEILTCNAVEIDILKEISNIGVSKAATALSEMINSRVDIAVPSCRMASYQEIGSIFGDPEKIYCSVLIQLFGDFDGFIMFCQELDNAVKTVKTLAKVDVTADVSDIAKLTKELAPLEEIANIMMGSYLASMEKLTKLNINQSVPSLCIDIITAIMNIPALVYANVSEEVLMVETKFIDCEIKGHFLLLPNFESFRKIIDILCV